MSTLFDVCKVSNRSMMYVFPIKKCNNVKVYIYKMIYCVHVYVVRYLQLIPTKCMHGVVVYASESM